MYDRVYKNSDKSPERRLFEAILIAFIIDAQKDYDQWRKSLNGISERLSFQLSQHRITARGRHIEMICELVDLDHNVFYRTIDRITTGEKNVKIQSIHW